LLKQYAFHAVDTPRNMKLVKEHLLRSTSLRSTIIGVIPGTKDPTTEGRW